MMPFMEGALRDALRYSSSHEGVFWLPDSLQNCGSDVPVAGLGLPQWLIAPQKSSGAGSAPAPPSTLRQTAYFSASVTTVVKAPVGSAVMIFWSSSALAVRS